jgi:transposase-like protein
MKQLVIDKESLKLFKSRPSPYQQIVDFIDNSDYTTVEVAKAIEMDPQAIYNFRTKMRRKGHQEGEVIKPLTKLKGRERYNPEQKFKLFIEFENLYNDDDRSAFYRKYGIYTSDMAKWKNDIKQSAIESLARKNAKNSKEKQKESIIEKLENDLAAQNHEMNKLKAMLDIQKKTFNLFGMMKD